MATSPTPPAGLAQRMQQERLTYPGLLPREIIVLRAWLKLHEREYDRFDYNVRIGAGHDPGPAYDESTRKQAILNTQKRIDAVAWKGAQVTLIEVKDRAGFAAVGQIVGYEAMWEVQFPNDLPPLLKLVSNRVVGDIFPVLNKNKISLDLVEASFDELRSRPVR